MRECKALACIDEAGYEKYGLWNEEKDLFGNVKAAVQ